MITETLSQITKAEADAVAAATKAASAAEAAKSRADQARQRADAERERANRDYLDLLAQEHTEARSTALSTAGESRAALEQAVRSGGDVFGLYIQWTEASIKVWEIDEGLARMRRFHGLPTRDVPAPAFDFNLDVGVIIDQLSLEAQDEAIVRIDARRADYLAGRKESS